MGNSSHIASFHTSGDLPGIVSFDLLSRILLSLSLLFVLGLLF